MPPKLLGAVGGEDLGAVVRFGAGDGEEGVQGGHRGVGGESPDFAVGEEDVQSSGELNLSNVLCYGHIQGVIRFFDDS